MKKMRTCSLFLLGMLVASTATAQAQGFSVLYNFGSRSGDPIQPSVPAVMAQGRDGSIYSTTGNGGIPGNGTAFKISPTGKLAVLFNFDVFNPAPGAFPQSGLSLGRDGNLYGLGELAGSNGWGTVFKITPNGNLTTIYNFTNDNDGAAPYTISAQGTDGNFYGTTSLGTGNIFKVTPSGVLTPLHLFNYTDGQFPYASLIEGTDGNFYGTTAGGGSNGVGTVYKITPSGILTSLYSFDITHGLDPLTPLVEGRDGNFYGTTFGGGSLNDGTVFKITPTGSLKVLHSFEGSDGSGPLSGLVQATDGNFYGTTYNGGTLGYGNLYRITSNGSFSVLYDFDGVSAANPEITLLQHTNGILYGSTNLGGTANFGTFYSFDLGLAPFVSLLPTSGKVGKSIGILGQGFKGTTAVSFNGTPANFSVKSGTYLTASVPTGATSGFVTVVTPGGTLKSNRKFRVRP